MSGAPPFDFRFLRQIAVTLAATALLVSYPLFAYATEEIAVGVLAGIGMSVVNVLMGYAAVEYSFHRSYTTFVQIVLGGIVLRLFVMAGLLVLLILAFKVHSIALISSLFVMYIVFLALEVLYIHNKWQDRIKNS